MSLWNWTRCAVLRHLGEYEKAMDDLQWLSANFNLETDPDFHRELASTFNGFGIECQKYVRKAHPKPIFGQC
jgi:hypothetical protein